MIDKQTKDLIITLIPKWIALLILLTVIIGYLK